MFPFLILPRKSSRIPSRRLASLRPRSANEQSAKEATVVARAERAEEVVPVQRSGGGGLGCQADVAEGRAPSLTGRSAASMFVPALLSSII